MDRLLYTYVKQPLVIYNQCHYLTFLSYIIVVKKQIKHPYIIERYKIIKTKLITYKCPKSL